MKSSGSPLHDARELAVLLLARAGDADVSHAPGGFQLLQDAELDRHVAEVVHLDEVHRLDAEPAEGRLDLRARGGGIGRAAAARRHVDLGRPEQLVRDAEFAREPAGDFLRRAVGRRRVEDRGAALDECGEHRAKPLDVRALGDAAKRGGAAEPDDRDLLAARGDGPRDERGRGRAECDARPEAERRAERHAHPTAAIDHEWSSSGIRAGRARCAGARRPGAWKAPGRRPCLRPRSRGS